MQKGELFMKKLTALFLVILMLLSASAAVFASADVPDSALLRGDANGDGKVTASDARIILRIAAKLDSAEKLVFAVIDVNESGDITAQDARLTLRVAAQLGTFENGAYITLPDESTTKEDVEPTTQEPTTQEPTTAEPEPPVADEPVDVKIIHSGTYEMVLNCTMDGSPMRMMMATDNGNLCLKLLGDESLDGVEVLVVNGSLYAAFTLNPNSDKKALMSEEDMRLFLKDGAEDMDEMKEMLEIISHLIPAELGEPAKTTIDGEPYLLYSYTLYGAQMQLYVTEEGKISRILMVGEYRDNEFIVESVSGSLSEDYFDLANNYVPLSKIN